MKPYLADADFTLYNGDALEVLRSLPDRTVDCCVTSPPYWSLRDYQVEGQFGLEPTPEEYVARMVELFREVRRVLAEHGTLWLNIGDSYWSDPKKGGSGTPNGRNNRGEEYGRASRLPTPREVVEDSFVGEETKAEWRAGLDPATADEPWPEPKQKDLVGIPWLLAFALRADGWYLRADIIWAKPNPMPESVTDRPTKAHEYLFLLSKRPRYYFDQEAVREPAEWARWGAQTYSPEAQAVYGDRIKPRGKNELTPDRRRAGFNERWDEAERNGVARTSRNVRSVWEIATQPYPEAHFATYPEELVRRAILAGCPEQICSACGKARERIVERTPMVVRPTPKREAWQSEDDHARTQVGGTMLAPATTETTGWTDCGHGAYRPGVVLDPFLGSGTTALVARKHGRACVGIELSPEYCALAARRLSQLSVFADAA